MISYALNIYANYAGIFNLTNILVLYYFLDKNWKLLTHRTPAYCLPLTVAKLSTLKHSTFLAHRIFIYKFKSSSSKLTSLLIETVFSWSWSLSQSLLSCQQHNPHCSIASRGKNIRKINKYTVSQKTSTQQRERERFICHVRTQQIHIHVRQW